MIPVRRIFIRNILPALLCAALLPGCSRVHNDPVAAVDGVFKLMEKGEYSKAFESTAFMFRAQQSEMAFEAIARDMGMGNYPSRRWVVKSNDGKTAELDGFFVSGNTEIPLKATAILESGKWKLFQLMTPKADESGEFVDRFTRIGQQPAFGDIYYRKVPSDKDLRALVTETMREFNNGLHKKDFSDFYFKTSQLWQSETSRAKVERAFKPFLDANINIDAFEGEKAVFSEPPRLSGEGMLLVKGYYPTQPNRVIFDLKYTFELPKWKLLAVTVSVKP